MERDVAIMLALGKRGASAAAIAEQFGVSRQMVKAILQRHNWKHVEAARRVPAKYAVYQKERPRGMSHPNRRLTRRAVASIRSSDANGVELAAKYGVSPTTISNVRKNKVWVQ